MDCWRVGLAPGILPRIVACPPYRIVVFFPFWKVVVLKKLKLSKRKEISLQDPEHMLRITASWLPLCSNTATVLVFIGERFEWKRSLQVWLMRRTLVSSGAEGPATQVKNLTGSQVAVKVSKYISCFCSQISLSFQCKSSIWNCKSVSKRQFANLWKRQSAKLENQTQNKQTPCKQCCCLPWFH
jgi:hypothetical protein